MKTFIDIESEIYTKDEYEVSEFISLSISQSMMIRYDISLIQYVIVSQIYKMDKKKVKSVPTVTYFTSVYPALFTSRKVARRILEEVLEKDLIFKKEINNKNTFAYYLTNKGKSLASNALYTLDYEKEDYFNMLQIIDYWNSKSCLSKHRVNPYGQVQTKNIHNSVNFIKDLYSGAEWTNNKKFTPDDVKEIIDDYCLKFLPQYLPNNKKSLTKSFSSFVMNNKGYSELLNIDEKGVEQSSRTIDDLKKINIAFSMLKKSYEVLSEFGKATEEEKLLIQKSLIKMYDNWKKHKLYLDKIYSWKTNYHGRFGNFNQFLYEILHYIENNVSNAKPGYISFREGNKIMESFSKYFADKHNIYIWPTKKQEERILRMKEMD